MTTRHLPVGQFLASAYRPVIAPDTWIASAYLLASGVLGAFWFALITAGVSVGLGLVPVYIGLLVLAVMPAIWRLGAVAERFLAGAVFDVSIAAPYRRLPGGTRLRRVRVAASDPATWKDLAYLLLLFPLGTLWTAIVATVWGHALSLAALPLYAYALPDDTIDWLAFGAINLAVDTWWKVTLACLAGLLLTAPAAWIIRGAASLHRHIAVSLLGASRAQLLATEALQLRQSRDRVVEAAAAERRRIERDLHDGAQQRLIALVMDLGIAKSKFRTDPAAAEPFVTRAHHEATTAITELRDLARGLHPAILAERGLDAALSALAGRSPVPVDIDVTLSRRPSSQVESTIYFVIAEALTNVAKHAHATRARVTVDDEPASGQLTVVIRDDGVGGATQDSGGGLVGLETRMAAIGGGLSVSSPAGGPTAITAEVPCRL